MNTIGYLIGIVVWAVIFTQSQTELIRTICVIAIVILSVLCLRHLIQALRSKKET